MTRHFLLIKGNMVQAIIAANSRGIILDNPRVLSGWMRRKETAAFCTAEPSTIAEWFCQGSDGAPYDEGELLFYRENPVEHAQHGGE